MLGISHSSDSVFGQFINFISSLSAWFLNKSMEEIPADNEKDSSTSPDQKLAQGLGHSSNTGQGML